MGSRTSKFVFVAISCLHCLVANQFVLAQTVDAALFARNYTYLFQGHQYYRFSQNADDTVRLDKGYPKNLPGGWRGLSGLFLSKIDAALSFPPNGKTYLFSGNQYVRISDVTVDPGYPKQLPGGWKGLPPEFHSGIDAALYIDGHTYFYKGNQYVMFTGTQMDDGYPQALTGLLKPFDSKIDAAFSEDKQTYTHFFSGNVYAEFEGANIIPGYPLKTTIAWPGMKGTLAGQTSDPIPVLSELNCKATPKLGGNCWTTEDLLDQRIDQHAQNVMMGMLSGPDSNAMKNAGSILCAVKENRLTGVYISNQQVPAKRAQAAGDSWWTMISPNSKSSACYKKPIGEKPLIVFQDKIKSQRPKLSTALSQAWQECDLSSVEEVCYRETITRPTTGKLSIEVVANDGLAGINNVAVTITDPMGNSKVAKTQNGFASFDTVKPGDYQINADACALGFGSQKVTKKLTSFPTKVRITVPYDDKCSIPIPPRDDVAEACESKGMCSPNLINACGVNGQCLVRKGNICGHCTDDEFKRCKATAYSVFSRNLGHCGEDEKDDALNCLPGMILCAANPSAENCVTALPCITGSPSHAKDACAKRAGQDLLNDVSRCKQRIINK